MSCGCGFSCCSLGLCDLKISTDTYLEYTDCTGYRSQSLIRRRRGLTTRGPWPKMGMERATQGSTQKALIDRLWDIEYLQFLISVHKTRIMGAGTPSYLFRRLAPRGLDSAQMNSMILAVCACLLPEARAYYHLLINPANMVNLACCSQRHCGLEHPHLLLEASTLSRGYRIMPTNP